MSVQLVYVKQESLYAMEIDATPSETHSYSADVTDHAVEKGANVSDHVRMKPLNLRLECIFTDYPLVRDNKNRIGNDIGVGTLSSTAALELKAFKPSGTGNNITKNPFEGRWKTLFSELQTMQTNGTLIQVLTTPKTYDNMVITDISAPRDKDSKGAIKFSLSLKQIRVVQTQQIIIPKAKSNSGKKAVNSGKQEAKTPTAAPDAKVKARSALKKLSAKFGDGLEAVGF